MQLVSCPGHTPQPTDLGNNGPSSGDTGSNLPDQAQPALQGTSTAPVDPQLQDAQTNGNVDSASKSSASDEQKINESKKVLANITSDLKQMVKYVFMHYAASDVAKALVQSTIDEISSQITTDDYKSVVQTIIQCMVAYYLEAVVFKDTRDAFQGVSGQDPRANNEAKDDSDKPSTSTPGCFTVLCSRFSRAQSNKSLDELAKKIDRIFTQLNLIHKEMGLDEAFSFETFFKRKHSPQDPSTRAQGFERFFSGFFIEQMQKSTIDKTSTLRCLI